MQIFKGVLYNDIFKNLSTYFLKDIFFLKIIFFEIQGNGVFCPHRHVCTEKIILIDVGGGGWWGVEYIIFSARKRLRGGACGQKQWDRNLDFKNKLHCRVG